MNIKALLGEHFCNAYNIEDKEYSIEWIEPVKLIVPERFDIPAKLCFVDAYLSGCGIEWAEQLYRKHVQVLSGGREKGNEKKNSIDAYVKIFKELIDDIETHGFDVQRSVIPVGEDNIIMDGAHRVAIAICLKKSLPIIRLPGLRSEYGFQFFQERLLDDIYMDYMALEYIKRSRFAYSACVWPRVGNSSKIAIMENLMQEHADIIYKKKLNLNYDGLCNLMIQAYKDFEWIGRLESKFSGVTAQADLCYVPNAPMYYYVLEIDSLEAAKKLKAEIREIYKVGNFSIHMTDTQEESLLIGKMLLNDSSVHFLNTGKPFEYISFYKHMDTLQQELSEDEINQLAITESSVFTIYGLKQSDELVITGDSVAIGKLSQKHVGGGKLICKELPVGQKKILYDPRCYFCYGRMKYFTLPILKKYSKLTTEEVKQVNAIQDSVQRQSISERFLREIKRRYRNYKRFTFEKIFKWLEKMNLLEVTRKVYHIIKGK